MPRYYCDYCDTYLTHDSPSVRKQHGAGYKHKANVRSYYQQFEEQQTQQAIDQRIKEHLGLQGGLGLPQVGAAYNQHLAGFPQRPQIPILPTPGLPGNPQAPLIPGMRPQVLARPMVGVPGYGYAPPMQPILGPPGASGPMQFNGLLRPPAMNAPTTMPAGTSIPTSNGNTSMTTPGVYQANPTAPTTGGFDGYNATATPDSQSLAPAASQSEE